MKFEINLTQADFKFPNTSSKGKNLYNFNNESTTFTPTPFWYDETDYTTLKKGHYVNNLFIENDSYKAICQTIKTTDGNLFLEACLRHSKELCYDKATALLKSLQGDLYE